MNGFLTSMVTVLTAIVGVAIVAVLVSKNAQTPQVTQSFFSGFSQALGTAVSPVTGNMPASSLSSPFGLSTANIL